MEKFFFTLELNEIIFKKNIYKRGKERLKLFPKDAWNEFFIYFNLFFKNFEESALLLLYEMRRTLKMNLK